MRLSIKGGVLEAEIEGNPLEDIQSQLQEAIQKQEDAKIKELKAKVSNMAKPRTITKTITKTVKKPDEGISRLHTTINNIKRVPISKYPRSDWKARQKIARAGVPVHSSESDQIGKLNAVPRMPI